MASENLWLLALLHWESPLSLGRGHFPSDGVGRKEDGKGTIVLRTPRKCQSLF